MMRALLLAMLALLALAGGARAHDMAAEHRMHAVVQADSGRLQFVVRVPLELMLNVDLPKRGNGYLDLARLDDALPRALQAVAKDIGFSADGQPLVLTGVGARIALPSDRAFESPKTVRAAVLGPPLPVATDVFWNQGYFDAVFEAALPSASARLTLDFQVAPGLRERLKLSLRYLTPAGEVRAFELHTGAGPVALDPRWFQAASTFAVSGLQHILGGADHLLFLLCLVVPFRRLGWQLVGVVTAFTLAHSVTLVCAALGWMPAAPAFPLLVEVLIAASILYMAVENLFAPRLRWRWLLTAAFGLVHGFGFSFGLAQELQFAGAHLALSLLAFNLGIEIGQLLVLALLWPLLTWVRARAGADARWPVLVLSAFIAHAAWHWLGERFDALAAAEWQALLPLLWPQGISVLLVLGAVAMAAQALRRPAPAVVRDGAD